MRRPLAVTLLAAAVLTACGPTVRYERAPDVRIDAGARWSWGPPDGDGLTRAEGALIPADSVDRALRHEIQAALIAKGFPLAPAESAAVIIHYHIGRRSVTDTLPEPDDRSLPGGVRSPGGWGGYGRPEDLADRTISWEEGMLVVDAVVPATGVVAWRGLIAGEIPAQAATRPAESIRDAVRRLMRGFP